MTVRELVEKKPYVNMVLVGLAAVFGLVALADAVGYGVRAARLGGVLETAEKKTSPDEEKVKEQLSQYRSVADELKKRNVFCAPPGKPKQPVCTGIFADMAILDGKPYTIGDEVSGAKILGMGGNYVLVEWEGEEVKLEPFATNNVQEGSSRSSGSRGSRGDDRRGSDRDRSRFEGGRGPGGGGPPEGRFRFQPSQEQMDRMREMRDRFMNASPEERERMREEFRRRMSEGGGGGPPTGFRGRGR